MRPTLMKNVTLKYLETPTLYDYKNNDLYEIDGEALGVVKYFDGKHDLDEIIQQSKARENDVIDFINYLIQNRLAYDNKSQKYTRNFNVKKSPEPSLRNLLVHVTTACNLKCIHCYVDKNESIHLKTSVFSEILRNYDEMQGLKVMITGGEPLLHPNFNELIEELSNYQFRKILFTNSLLINEEKLDFLNDKIEEIQISIDGTKSHDLFRNREKSFDATIEKIKMIKNYDFTISISTMIHEKNLSEMNDLQDILRDLKVDNWYLDVPVITGEYKKYPDYHAKLEAAAEVLNNYGWGEQIYDWEDNYACGTHLCAVMSNGDVAKCGLFASEPVSNLNEKTLSESWDLIIKDYIWKQANLKCFSLHCPYIADCRGGCRFRARELTGDLFDIDEIKCRAFKFKID
ncbi:MAG: radical SAM protein [Candidatus Helarchaeota archaeon]